MNNKEIIENKFRKLITNKTITSISVPNKSIIFHEGDTCSYLGYVLKGKINISTLSIDGKEEIISSLNSGDFFGQFLIYNSQNNKYLGDIIAQTNTEILLINKKTLDNILINDVEFLHAYIGVVSEESYKIKQQVKMLSHKKNTDRVIYYLTNNSVNNQINIVNITHLAKIVNLPRENVSRIISALIKKGAIKKDKNIITILDLSN